MSLLWNPHNLWNRLDNTQCWGLAMIVINTEYILHKVSVGWMSFYTVRRNCKQVSDQYDDELERFCYCWYSSPGSLADDYPSRQSPKWPVRMRKLRWYCHITRSPGLAKITLQGTVQGGRKRGRITSHLKPSETVRAAEDRQRWREMENTSSVVPQWPSGVMG